jgi:hypothetical protein
VSTIKEKKGIQNEITIISRGYPTIPKCSGMRSKGENMYNTTKITILYMNKLKRREIISHNGRKRFTTYLDEFAFNVCNNLSLPDCDCNNNIITQYTASKASLILLTLS